MHNNVDVVIDGYYHLRGGGVGHAPFIRELNDSQDHMLAKVPHSENTGVPVSLYVPSLSLNPSSPQC